MQGGILLAVGLQAQRFGGMLGQVAVDRCLPLRRQPAIDPGLQFGFVHFTTFKLVATGCPAISRRKLACAAQARHHGAKRDIERGRHVFVAHVFQRHQQQDFALGRGQLLQGPLQAAQVQRSG